VAKEAGGRNRSLTKKVVGVEVTDELLVELAPNSAAKIVASVLSGIEIHAEGW
jgi:hypothetical protein